MGKTSTGVIHRIYRLAIWENRPWQDCVEYALLAGLVAVASGLFLPGLSENMCEIYTELEPVVVGSPQLTGPRQQSPGVSPAL